MSSSLAADARLAAVAATQAGVFARAQATAAGFSAAQIERRVRAGVWHRMFHAVYRHAGTPGSVGARQWGAILWAGQGSVLSHTSAAAIWRIPVVPGLAPEVLVTATRAPRVAGVTVHRVTRLRAVDVVRVQGLPVTVPVRTLVDLAAVLAADDLRAALEHAFARDLVTVRAVVTGLDEMGSAGRPGAARLRVLLAAFGSGVVRPSARMAG
ncbi:MAG: hypothetical protein QOG65_2432 [Actinomycetota bacterium]|jgi:hypothetical protein|nr:hypothetical protein [Actinomycetota bacterium]